MTTSTRCAPVLPVLLATQAKAIATMIVKMIAMTIAMTGCLGDTGTVSVALVTAPGSPLLSSVERIRLTLSEPRTVVEARRGAQGFSLALEASADGDPGALAVECFDAADRLVGYGRSPAFALGPITARIVVYIAAPASMAEAPVKLAASRFEVASARLSYGAIIVGGRDNGNAVRPEIEIYNAFDHTLRRGLDLPQPRAGATVATTIDGQVYILGGLGPDNLPKGTSWRFDSNVAPAGSFVELTPDETGRAGQRAIAISISQFLLTGAPAVLDAGSMMITPVAGLAALPRDATAVVVGDRVVVIAAGSIVARYRDGIFDQLAIPAAVRTGHAVVTTSDGQAAVIGGELQGELTRDAVKIDPISGAGTTISNVLETPRRRAAVTRAGNRILVAGGIEASGNISSTAEILDAETLAHLATISMLGPRAEAVAETLPNDQVLLIGGIDGRGRPTDVLELFTPGPPDVQP
jgi:hypothetical protein